MFAFGKNFLPPTTKLTVCIFARTKFFAYEFAAQSEVVENKFS